MPFSRRFFGALVLIGIFVAAGVYFAFRSRILGQFSLNDPSTITALTPLVPSPAPSVGPFIEMTIPHLRQRTYQSQLSELQKNSENASYTSYLTSYDSDGLKINAQLTVPKGEKPTNGWPAIVFIHGYIPPTQYQTLQRYGDYVSYLARNGFVVLKIDLRGHGSSEGEPGGAYYSADYIIDALNARAALQSSDLVNPNKIGLWGHSMAGNIALRSAAAQPEIQAIVIWAGAVYSYSDMAELGISDNSYRPPSTSSVSRRRRTELFEAYGQFSTESPFWKQVAPTNYLDDLKGAIQVHHAIDDAVVDVEYSRNLMKLLDETSVPHELYEYKTGGHNITGSSFNQAMQRTADFFKEKLKDE